MLLQSCMKEELSPGANRKKTGGRVKGLMGGGQVHKEGSPQDLGMMSTNVLRLKS